MKRLTLFTTLRIRYRFSPSGLNSNVQNIKHLNAMKRVSLLAGLFLLMSTSLFAEEPFSVQTFSPAVTSTINTVEVTTSNGRIILSGNAMSRAVVEMFVTQNNVVGLSRMRRSNEDIQQILNEEYIIDIRVEKGTLYASARLKNPTQTGRQKLNISFRVTVPEHVNSELRTTNAGVSLSNLSGVHNFRTTNGSLTVDNVSGRVIGKTTNGSVTVTNSGDEINITTTNGSMTARNLLGAITLKTTNGSININNVNGVIHTTSSNGSVTANTLAGEFRTSTSNGSVRLTNISGNVNARTTNGGINATMVSVENFVTLSTTNGNINLTVPSGKGYELLARAQRITTSGLANFNGITDTRTLDGRTGNGGAKIDLRTSGRANLTFN